MTAWRFRPLCQPAGMNIRSKRTWRGTQLEINFKRTGEFSITLKGNKIEGNSITADELTGNTKNNINVTF